MWVGHEASDFFFFFCVDCFVPEASSLSSSHVPRHLLPPASVTATASVSHVSERSLESTALTWLHSACARYTVPGLRRQWPRGFPSLHGAFKVGRLGNPGPHKASGFSGSGYLHFWELAVLWKERNEKQNPFGPQHYPPFSAFFR